MLADIILPNESVINHFARRYKLSSLNGPLEKQLIEGSDYNRVILREFIRTTFSAIANIPSKSISFLATDYERRDINDLASRANQLFNWKRGDNVKPILAATLRGYFEGAILELSNFAETGKREKFQPELAVTETIDLIWSQETYFHKTFDGFLIGDAFAHLGLASSENFEKMAFFNLFELFSYKLSIKN